MASKVVTSDPDCTFCSIVEDYERGFVVYENETVVAFLDVHPVFEGHVLVVPRKHVRNIFELPNELIEPLFAATKVIACALELGLGADGALIINNNRISQSVDHMHIHVIPRNKKDGLRGFMWPRKKYADEEAQHFASRIRSALEELQ